jgi:RNA polymerase sigma-70 factor (ECF subfamily)
MVTRTRRDIPENVFDEVPDEFFRECHGAVSSRVLLTGQHRTCQVPRRMVEQPEGSDRSAPESQGAALSGAVPMLKRLAERMCGNPADAMDLVQDTLERAAHGIPPEVRNVRAWLTTILQHLFIDYCRAKNRRPSHEPIDDKHEYVTQLEADGPEPEWTRITVADIRNAADELEPVYREVYILRTFEQRSYDDIARQLGIARVTVGTRLHRARHKLRDVLVARFALEDKP